MFGPVISRISTLREQFGHRITSYNVCYTKLLRIGRATALLAAQAGADVALTCRSRQAEADAVAGEIRQLGRKAWVGTGDLGDEATVTRLFDEAGAALGPLDGYVGNAGIWPEQDVGIRDMGVARWRETMRANLDA